MDTMTPKHAHLTVSRVFPVAPGTGGVWMCKEGEALNDNNDMTKFD